MNKTATAPTAEEKPVVVDEAQEQADFDAGAAMENEPEPKTPAATEDQPRDDNGRFAPVKAETKKKAEPKPEEKPEYVQLTKQQFEEFVSSSKKTAEFEKQFSKIFGTIGDQQKIVKALQSQTPRGLAVKIPDGAFAAMEKDFPELAQHTRAALEATLKGLEGTGDSTAKVDMAEFEQKVEDRVLKLAIEDLEDEYPDWRKIVGAVSKGETPDANNPFRKWLATKDKAYQDRINGSNSAGVITRAIRTFKSEIKVAPAVPAKSNQKALQRTSRIQDALRPKGDGGQPPVKNADDEFEAGFKTG